MAELSTAMVVEEGGVEGGEGKGGLKGEDAEAWQDDEAVDKLAVLLSTWCDSHPEALQRALMQAKVPLKLFTRQIKFEELQKHSAAERKRHGLRVGTWNLNYGTNEMLLTSPACPASQSRSVVGAVLSLDVDILFLQEVCNVEAADDKGVLGADTHPLFTTDAMAALSPRDFIWRHFFVGKGHGHNEFFSVGLKESRQRLRFLSASLLQLEPSRELSSPKAANASTPRKVLVVTVAATVPGTATPKTLTFAAVHAPSQIQGHFIHHLASCWAQLPTPQAVSQALKARVGSAWQKKHVTTQWVHDVIIDVCAACSSEAKTVSPRLC